MNVGIIPVRLQSERFSDKLIQPLLGKPIIQHVIENALNFDFIDKLVIATDSPNILDYIEKYDLEYFFMGNNVWCGSQRSYYYYLQNPQYDNYISIPADEPMLDPDEINYSFNEHKPVYPIYTFYSPFYSLERLESLLSCKVIGNDKALYFSRKTIPTSKKELPLDVFKKHVGIFVFTNEVFKKHGDKLWSNHEGSYAKIESLEQNIFIENGFDVGLIKTKHKYWGIDLPEHIKEIEELYREKKHI
ncbi:MAG: cytidylyltransferase domain-containing protein [archaeon]